MKDKQYTFSTIKDDPDSVLSKVTKELVKKISENPLYWQEWVRLENINPGIGGAKQVMSLYENTITVTLEYDPNKYKVYSDE
jgi:hypothetical protein